MENQNISISIDELSKNYNLKLLHKKKLNSSPLTFSNVQKRINNFSAKLSNSIILDLSDVDFNITDDDCLSELDW